MNCFYCGQFGPTPSRSSMTLKREGLRPRIWHLERFLCTKSEGLVFTHCEWWTATVPSPIPTPLPPLFNSSLPSSTYGEPPELPESTTPPLSAADNSPSFEYPAPTSSTSNENCATMSAEGTPRTVEIMSEENVPSKDSLISFYTTNTHKLGTRQNPIDINLIPEQSIVPLPRPTGVRRIQSIPITMQCMVCTRTGHMAQVLKLCDGDGVMECDGKFGRWCLECVDRRRGRGRVQEWLCGRNVMEMWQVGRCVTEGGQRWQRCDGRGNVCVVPLLTELGVC